MLERLELTAGIAKLLRLLHGHRGRNDNCCQDHGYAWVQHLTRRSSATAGGGERCFHFILHNSSFSLSVRRPAVGLSDWLGIWCDCLLARSLGRVVVGNQPPAPLLLYPHPGKASVTGNSLAFVLPIHC